MVGYHLDKSAFPCEAHIVITHLRKWQKLLYSVSLTETFCVFISCAILLPFSCSTQSPLKNLIHYLVFNFLHCSDYSEILVMQTLSSKLQP